MYTDQYVKKSLELHLFSGRIMKEHALFLEAGFTPANASFARQAEKYKNEFENLLRKAVALADGIVSQQVLSSGELVTEFTAVTECQTERFTKVAIDGTITAQTMRLTEACRCPNTVCRQQDLCSQVHCFNETALQLLDGLIAFKETVLEHVLHCRMFTANYPLLIEHIIREAKLYRENVEMLEQEGHLPMRTDQEVECFWNQIMMEHALFMRGLLDPTETELIESADAFAKAYKTLLEHCSCISEKSMTMDALEETVRFQKFKTAGTKGISACSIRSVILPLLADHVLREANHYLRILRS